MENSVTIERERQLFLLLRQTYTLIYQAIEADLRESGCVPYTQASVLFVLKTIGEPATPTEISRWLLREKHTVSELLSRMEKQGLVSKTKDLKRKNLVRVTLTDKGEESLCHGMMEERAIRKIMSCLSNEEQDSLRGHLEKLRSKALEEPKIRYRLPMP